MTAPAPTPVGLPVSVPVPLTVPVPVSVPEPLPRPLPGMPLAAGESVFREPWEAHAFALAVSLHQRGLYTWPEWAAALAAQIAAAQAAGDADVGVTYYHHWLAALEALVAAKGASSADELARYRNAWDHAADRTPHGQPIALCAGDFGFTPSPSGRGRNA
jgi:nitrile hydratase accessory protein